MALKTGDTVQLKSGGAIMTVTDVPMSVDGFYECSWHGTNSRGTHSPHREHYPETALKKVKAPEG